MNRPEALGLLNAANRLKCLELAPAFARGRLHSGIESAGKPDALQALGGGGQRLAI